MTYGRREAICAFSVASGVLYLVGFLAVWLPMNTAKSEFFECTSGRNPQSDNSYSRRSSMPISVGHFWSVSPSSLLKTCEGSPSTLPPFSAPRIAVHQPFFANESVSRAPST